MAIPAILNCKLTNTVLWRAWAGWAAWGYEDTKPLAPILVAEGFECKLDIFEQRLARALRFVTELEN